MSVVITLNAQTYVDLTQHEAAGGHTIALHVNTTDVALQQRLAHNTSLSSASRFTDLAAAENAVNALVQANLPALNAWLQSNIGRARFDHDMQTPIGCLLRRLPNQSRTGPSPATRLRVIVTRPSGTTTLPFLVLTAFPVV